MGKTLNTGNLTNAIFQDSSNNIAIGDTTASGYKFKVTGTSNLNGALSGTSATFSGNVGIGVTPNGSNGVLSTNGYAGTLGDSSKRRGLAVYSTAAENADQPGVILGYDTSGAGIVAARTNGTGQPLTFWTYNGSAWGERFRIASTGAATFSSSVGIGTSPSERLDVFGPNASGPAVRWRNDGGRKSGYLYSDSGGVGIYDTNLNDAGIYLAGNTQIDFRVNGSERMRITSGGDVVYGVTAAKDTNLLWRSDFTGTIHARIYATGLPRIVAIAGESGGVQLTNGATSWTSNSDETLKNINGFIENAVDKINTLRAVNFSWKSDETKKENLGLIAQDVKSVFPQIVDIDEEGILGVRYTELIPVLVKAIQEQQAQIEELKALIAAK